MLKSLRYISDEFLVVNYLNGAKLTRPKHCLMTNEHSNPDLRDLRKLPFPFFIADKNESRALFVNDACAQQTHSLSANEMIGKNAADITDVLSANKVIKNDQRVLKEQNLLISEETGIVKYNNMKIHTVAIKIPLYSEKNLLIGVLGLGIEAVKLFNYIFSESKLQFLNTESIFNYINGNNYISKSLKNQAIDTPAILTKRELECLYWSSQGKSSNEICVILNLTPYTIDSYLKSAANKLKASNRTHAVAKAIHAGLI